MMKLSLLKNGLNFRSDVTFVGVCVGLVAALVLGLVVLFPEDEVEETVPADAPEAADGKLEEENIRVRQGRAVRHDN